MEREQTSNSFSMSGMAQGRTVVISGFQVECLYLNLILIVMAAGLLCVSCSLLYSFVIFARSL